MFFLYRVTLAPSRGKREETGRLLAQSKAEPGYTTLESALEAMREFGPSRASRLEIRQEIGKHSYTVATWALDRKTGLPILSRPLGTLANLPQRAETGPVASSQERGYLIDRPNGPVATSLLGDNPDSPKAKPVTRAARSKPLFDTTGKPVKSRARRRAERKALAAGIDPATQLATGKAGFTRLDARPGPAATLQPKPAPQSARIPHSVSVQVAPFAPLRSRVKGEHSRLARLDASNVQPLGKRVSGKSTRDDRKPVPLPILRQRWEQESKALEHHDSETSKTVETRVLPLPAQRTSQRYRTYKRRRVAIETVEPSQPAGRAGYSTGIDYRQPLTPNLPTPSVPTVVEREVFDPVRPYRPVY